MKNLIENIIDYMKYLRDNYDLSISVHFNKEYSLKFYLVSAEKLLNYNAHINPYCMKIKSICGRKCILCQRRILGKIKKTPTFTGICHADVSEYIHAIFDNEDAVGFICVSGYKSETCRFEKDIKMQQLYNLNIKNQAPPVNLLNKIIPPLCSMFELLLYNLESFETDKFDTKTNDYKMILNYLRENHSNVSLESLSRQFNYSKSYISHLFKKNNNNTILHYCNTLKINDAKQLLKNTAMSVTDIAFTVGFNDLSYFINVFKKATGKTPLAWRKAVIINQKTIS